MKSKFFSHLYSRVQTLISGWGRGTPQILACALIGIYYWVQVIADIVYYVFTVFGCPSYFTDGGDILNDSILYSFIAVLCKI